MERATAEDRQHDRLQSTKQLAKGMGVLKVAQYSASGPAQVRHIAGSSLGEKEDDRGGGRRPPGGELFGK